MTTSPFRILQTTRVSRKTFYYHFQDIYDLVEWTLCDDAQRILADGVMELSWKDGLRRIVGIIAGEKRALVLNAYRSLGRDTLVRYLSALFMPLMDRALSAYPGNEKLSEQDRRFTQQIYSYGLIGLLLRWIENDMRFDENVTLDLIDQFFTTSIEDWIARRTRA